MINLNHFILLRTATVPFVTFSIDKLSDFVFVCHAEIFQIGNLIPCDGSYGIFLLVGAFLTLSKQNLPFLKEK